MAENQIMKLWLQLADSHYVNSSRQTRPYKPVYQTMKLFNFQLNMGLVNRS